MKHVFFFCWWLEFLLLPVWRQGRLQNGDASVFGSIKTLGSVSFLWYVCVIVGCMMMVWQGSYQVRCARPNLAK
jgi:hypothetical protein